MVQMANFDEKDFLDRAEHIYSQRTHIEKLADKACGCGIQNVLICSVGGSQATIDPFGSMIDHMSVLPVYSVQAADLITSGCNMVGPGTLVLMASKSGDTIETVKAAQWLHKRGAKIFSSTGPDASPLANLSDYAFHFGDGRPLEFPFYFFVGRILANRSEFKGYENFASALEMLGEALNAVRKQFDERARAYAHAYCAEPYHIWVASGDLWSVCYSYAMCVLEESLWIRTKSVTSAEFFHGTLELLGPSVPLTLLIGEGPTRELDLRVARFAANHTDKLTIIDAADFALPSVLERWRVLLGPVLINAALQRISKNLEVVCQHSLDTRRYYRKEVY